MSLHVIVGAGAVGSTTARLLVDQGHQVRMISRSGSGPEHASIERVAADASDAEALARLTTGAAALYNTANPLYYQWLTDWPPLAHALRTAAERSGAVLTTAGNLYPYGPMTGPMTEETPLAATHPKLRMRGDIWKADLAAHQAGRIRTTEVRASDYIEANSILSFVMAKPLLAGKRAFVPAKLDLPHSFTAIKDVARMLVIAATDERAWGRAWHVPTNDPVTVRQLAQKFTDVAGAPAPKLTALPYPALWAAGLRDPFVKELRTTYYQWSAPYVLDSSLAQETFDIRPTPLAEALRTAADAARD
jgi:nucleoside-diphosphate-sugar epimerase